MDQSNTHCVMPHKALALQNHGDFCVCNLNNMSFETKTQQVMYVHNTSLRDAWNSHTRKMVATALDRNRELPACSHCFDLERSGNSSSREKFNSMFDTLPTLTTQPQVFILKPGNTCNLACRMCNPATSSGWYKDAYQLAIKNEGFSGTAAEYSQTFEHIRNSFNRDNTEFWDTFVEWLPNMVFVDIYGGEPFLTPALFDALERVVDTGQSQNTSLQLHTNMTIFNLHHLEILSKFKSVKIGLSIDSDQVAELEYIRYPVKFDVVIENLEKFKQISKKYKNITMHIITTVTPLNVLHISRIKQKLNQHLPTHLNIVTSPGEYDIRHIPLPVRKVIAKQNPIVATFIMQTVPGCDIHWPKFWQHTKDLDRLRGQSFEDTFPEFYELIKPYVNVVFKS
jgi:sulfatase maturation enzyme AslB (radical SAM superfamily)